jgi:hypothetical protein
MATYIHKNGPEAGTIVLEEYELGISDAAYAYTKIGTNITPIQTKYADVAGNIMNSGGVVSGDDIFLKSGNNQIVSDPNPTFQDELTVANKITCPVFEGTATRAKYADLAENYETDSKYEPGTVVYFGDKTEVSIKTAETELPMGIVSENPGFLLNDKPEFKKYVSIALKGRIPVKLKGTAKRGDILVADRQNPGYAKVDNNALGLNVLGVCLNYDGKNCEIKV